MKYKNSDTHCNGMDNMGHSIPGNVRLVHEDYCKPDPQWTHKPLEWFVGRAVKMAFQSAESAVESMWVKVTDVEADNLVGTLDNDPVCVYHLTFGDRVVLNRTQIENVVCLD